MGQHLLVHHSVRHDYRLIVTGGRKQRIACVIRRASHSVLVQAYRLVRFGGQIQVEPQHLLVIGGHQQIVTLRVDGHVRNPFAVGQQLLDQLLFDQIVDSNVLLGLVVDGQMTKRLLGLMYMCTIKV